MLRRRTVIAGLAASAGAGGQHIDALARPDVRTRVLASIHASA